MREDIGSRDTFSDGLRPNRVFGVHNIPCQIFGSIRNLVFHHSSFGLLSSLIDEIGRN